MGVELKTRAPKRTAIQPDRYLELFEKLSPLVSAHSVDEIADAACRWIADLLDVAACSMMIADTAANGLALRAATHIPPTEWHKILIPFDSGLAGSVYSSGQPLLLRRAKDFTDRGLKPQEKYGRDSCVVVPIINPRGESIGVINVSTPRRARPFKDQDVRMIEAAARLISGGLENARLQERLAVMHERLVAIFDNLHIGVVALNPHLAVVQHNSKFAEIVAHPSEELQSKTLRELLPPLTFTFISRLAREAASTGTVQQELFEGQIGAEKLQMNITVSPVQEIQEGAGALLLMIEDIGQGAEVQRLRESDSLKRAFIRMISHELRTPLTVLQGTLPLVKSCCTCPPESVQQRLEQVEKLIRPNVARLTGVVNSILDVMDLENGQMDLARRPVDVNAVIRERVTSIAESAARKQIEFREDLAPDLAKISGDPDRMKQVFFALFDNAIKFSDPKSAVDVTSRMNGERIIVRVVNRGQGIEADQRGQIFEKFHQIDHEVTRKCGGCGLGLFLSRNIIQLHGGEIEIMDSASGETVFEIRLPFIPADAS